MTTWRHEATAQVVQIATTTLVRGCVGHASQNESASSRERSRYISRVTGIARAGGVYHSPAGSAAAARDAVRALSRPATAARPSPGAQRLSARGVARPSCLAGARLAAGLLSERPSPLAPLGRLGLEPPRLAGRYVVALALHVAEEPRALHTLLEAAHQLFETLAVASDYLHALTTIAPISPCPSPHVARRTLH